MNLLPCINAPFGCPHPSKASRRCIACYRYWKRKGTDRTQDQIIRANRRAHERALERGWLAVLVRRAS